VIEKILMYNATVTQNIKVNEALFKLSVKLDDEAISSYLPGQYTTLGMPKPGDATGKKFLKRAYSLCSSPDSSGELEFFISLVQGGELTPRLLPLQVGDRVLCGPKITGTFTLSAIPAQSHLILVGTGTGLAPYLSMLRTKSTWEKFRDIVLINGFRYEYDLAYQDEIEIIAQRNPGLRFIPIVSRPQGQWDGHTGRIQKLFLEHVVEVDPERSHVFLCGNPAMIEETQAMLETFGLKEHTKKQAGNIHIEKYW
jgi:ferredoxin--NADP+ reductase